jgi:hypothetical protein
LVGRPLRCGDLGAILAFRVLTEWTTKRNELRRQSHMLERTLMALGNVAVTWGNGRQERLGPYKTEAVAQELIKAQLAAWHEGQKLFLKPPR